MNLFFKNHPLGIMNIHTKFQESVESMESVISIILQYVVCQLIVYCSRFSHEMVQNTAFFSGLALTHHVVEMQT